MTNAERAKALVVQFHKSPVIVDEMETLARLAIRAAVEDEVEGILRLCMEFASKIDRNHGGDAIRELTSKIRDRAR